MARAEKLRRQSERDAKRRADARSAGVCVLCFVNPAVRDRCDECKAKRKDVSYFPVDEELSQPAIIALRRLRFFDWTTLSELAGACSIADDAHQAFSASVYRQVKSGRIERRIQPYWTPHGTAREYQIRITQAGRDAVTRLYERINAETKKVAA